ncbi:MAG: DivIVA domain-containing protein [Nocardioidaceae bacterium]
MPLTPEDVSARRFQAVRLQQGYDMAEVDSFLDEVEAELVRLLKENEDLRARLSPQQRDASPAAPPSTAAHDGPGEAEAGAVAASQGPAGEATAAAGTVPAAPATPTAPTGTIKVTTAAEASTAATRLLEIATHNADQLVDEARDQAGSIVAQAQARAEQLETDTKDRTDRLEADARTRAQMLDAETDERRATLFGDLDREKERLDGEVGNLRAFEREYRARLKSYFQQQLAALDGGGEDGSGGERLKTLLGDEQSG